MVFAEDAFGCSRGGGRGRRDELRELLEVEEPAKESEVGGGGGDGSWETSCCSSAGGGRRKRRLMRSVKNREEAESQRMTHIAVERNRRRFDRRRRDRLRERARVAAVIAGSSEASWEAAVGGRRRHHLRLRRFIQLPAVRHLLAAGCEMENRAGTGDIEVTMAESHVSLKVLARRRPRQLLKLAAGLQSLCLAPLHLNVTSTDEMAMYSFSLKVRAKIAVSSAKVHSDDSSSLNFGSM
ncbi:hypothetical protein ZIOFF_025839 [Zingiber officinale]|uniref:Uncharacterized protein n=1 Tax=Zingiber officinale TaxID=94328 RepID=A0A8J5GYB6_ZINOF|nr:hypothetical protein ZIOFF_025839 [Zingiber officinale]